MYRGKTKQKVTYKKWKLFFISRYCYTRNHIASSISNTASQGLCCQISFLLCISHLNILTSTAEQFQVTSPECYKDIVFYSFLKEHTHSEKKKKTFSYTNNSKFVLKFNIYIFFLFYVRCHFFFSPHHFVRLGTGNKSTQYVMMYMVMSCVKTIIVQTFFLDTCN